ncbi:MAG: hypothetical protein ABL953_10020 [Ilumatobacteraceae bacterium]
MRTLLSPSSGSRSWKRLLTGGTALVATFVAVMWLPWVGSDAEGLTLRGFRKYIAIASETYPGFRIDSRWSELYLTSELPWVCLGASTVLLVGACIPSRAQRPVRLLAVTVAVFSAIATLMSLVGGGLNSTGAGFWIAVVGYVTVAISMVVPVGSSSTSTDSTSLGGPRVTNDPTSS